MIRIICRKTTQLGLTCNRLSQVNKQQQKCYNPYPTPSLRGPATQPLHNEARSAELWWMGGWMDGWVGGDLLPLLFFVIFKYDNKQNELHPKTAKKLHSSIR